MTTARRVLKFELGSKLHARVLMPRGAIALYVAQQAGTQTGHVKDYVWALCDEAAPLEERLFVVCNSGDEYPEGMRYIGSWMAHDRYHVWHLFEPASAPHPGLLQQ